MVTPRQPHSPLVRSWENDAAFDDAKAALSDAFMLHHPCSGTPLAVGSDALDAGVHAVLVQFLEGE